jgi:two-component system, NtrC family, sensor kinase
MSNLQVHPSPLHAFQFSHAIAGIRQNPLQLLKSLWDGVSYGIFVLDVLDQGQEFRFAAFNPATAFSSPIPVEQLLGKTLAEAFPESVAALYRDRYRTCVETGSPLSFEEQLLHQGQETTWLLTVNPLLADPEATLTHPATPPSPSPAAPPAPVEQLLVTLLDITQRVRLEAQQHRTKAALVESEAKFRHLVENANDVIVLFGVDSVLSYISPSFQTLFGYDPADWLGKSFVPLVHPEDLPRCVAANHRVMETGEKYEGLEFRHGHRQGHWVWVSINISPIKDETGQVTGMQGILRDIRDRKLAEAELTKLSLVVQHTTNIVIITDAKGLVEWTNASFEHTTGYSLAEVQGKKPGRFLQGPDTDPQTVQRIREAIQTQTAFHGEILNYHKNGTPYWLDLVITPVFNPQGELMHFISIEMDITDRKLAEATLRDREAQLRTINAYVPGVIYQYQANLNTGDHRFTYMSPGAAGLYEVDLDTLAADPNLAFAMIHPDDWPRLMDGISQTVQNQRPWLDEFRLKIPSGRIKWVQAKSEPVDAPPGFSHYNGVMIDISDRKAAELALQSYADRQTRLNDLANQIRQSLNLETVIATALASIQELLGLDQCAFAWYEDQDEQPVWHLIQAVNRPGIPSHVGRYPVAVVGVSKEQLLSQDLMQIDDVEDCLDPIHQAFLQAIHCQSEVLLPIHAQGGRLGLIICTHYRQVRVWSRDEVELLKAVGNQLAIAIDQAELYAESRSKSQKLQQTLQELQRSQAQILQNEKMSSLGQLVAGIAHEINNPVSFIHGNVVHAEDYIQELLTLIALYQQHYPQPVAAIADHTAAIDFDYLRQDLPKLLASMQMGTERIRDIVQSLRLFSRLDEAEVKSIDIHAGLDSALMILQSRLKGNGDRRDIQIIKNYGQLPHVECFASQLNQVFMNLLVNAIDALDGCTNHGTSDDYLPYIGITTMTQDDRVLIRVADNGSGIPTAIQAQIFDPFFTTKPIGQGTGMGLSISYQIITDKHQGQLSCQSTPGHGTEFVIQIPLRQ